MANISEPNRTLAQTLATTFGGQPNVVRFWDDDHESSIDILSCADSPQTGVVSCATVGLSDFPLYWAGKEYPVRVEFVGACGVAFPGFDNALASAAFCVINTRWFCFPGAVFPKVLSAYGYANSLPHLFFTTPFLWQDEFRTVEFPEKKVTWLQAIPISEGEWAFSVKYGPAKLEALFEERQIDVFNLCRHSIV